MTGRFAASWIMFCFGLAGCSSTIGLYHSAEGGAIAERRQPPPGADAPYPNLASVPAAPVALSPAAQGAVGQRLAGGAGSGGVSAPSPEALAGLALPGAAPPLPQVPDLVIPSTLPPPPLPKPVAPPPVVAATPPSAPVALAFTTGSALLNPDAAVALRGVAAASAAGASGGGTLLVAGFGEAGGAPDAKALGLALARAQRLADALTADGVPPTTIRLLAMADGSGGFVQLFY